MTNLASSMVAILLRDPALPATDLSSMRMLSCGGSPLPARTVRRAIAEFGCPFFCSYGTTETSGKISISLLSPMARVTSCERQLELICSSGRPFQITSIKIVPREGDREGTGEIYVCGPAAFEGYGGGAEKKTTESFEGDWFKTGDLGYVDEWGYLHVVDREKDMILVRLPEGVLFSVVGRSFALCTALVVAGAGGRRERVQRGGGVSGSVVRGRGGERSVWAAASTPW